MAEMPIRQERIQGDGLVIHAQVAGSGPPVVLLHGFPENGHSWRHQIPVLAAAGLSAWVPNLRGYPPSDISPRQEDYHLSRLVNDLAAVVTATGHGRASIVGHDWGGIVAWAFAGACPLLLDRLVILNTPHMQIYGEKVWRTSQLFRSAYIGFFQLPCLPERMLSAADFQVVRRMFKSLPTRPGTFGDGDIERYVQGLSQPGALKAALDYYRANLESKALDLARSARTEAPVLVIWGEKDPALGLFLLEGLERFAPRVRIHRIAGSSHWVQNEAPEEVNRVLLDFLGRPA